MNKCLVFGDQAELSETSDCGWVSERDRQTERERQTDRERETDIERERERDRERFWFNFEITVTSSG